MTERAAPILRLGFAGTPPFAAAILEALVTSHRVAAVYCQPPRPTGRGRKVEKCAVQRVAERLNIDVRSPTTLRGEADKLRADALDALIVAAYGLILPKSILTLPKFGCINVHASLLPRWRGAAPIERAIMAGDSETGITIMQMDAGLDTGPILHCVATAVTASDTGDSLTARLATIGAAALIECLGRLETITPQPQAAAGVTYAAKLVPAESLVDWAAPALAIALKIRALCSRQPAFSNVGDERIRWLFADVVNGQPSARPGTILAVEPSGIVIASAHDAVRVTRLALSRGSGKPMDAAAFFNGHRGLFTTGQVIASP
jgi:methionyl-tRNA formyltransferase